MKHVFFIHSPITNMVTREIIHSKNLNKKDCIIISLDIYEKNIVKHYFEGVPIHIFPQEKFSKKKQSILARELSLYFWINKKLNFKKYIYYTIHDKVFLSKYISNNFKCKEYYYIEEGLGSFHQENSSHYTYKQYNIYEYIYKLLPVRLPRFIAIKKINLKRILPKATFLAPSTLYSNFEKLKGAYKISEKAFQFIDNTVLLCFTSSGKKLDVSDAPFFIFDNLVDSQICTLKTLTNVFKMFLEEEKITILNIKFHPLQPANEVAVWEDLLKKNNISYFIIDNSIALEEYIGNNHYIFYGFVSSLLYYNVNMSKGNGHSGTYLKRVYDMENQQVPDYYQKVLGLFSESGIQIK